MKLLLPLVIFVLAATGANAQDTTYLYFDSTWAESTKSNAWFYGKLYEKDGKWKRQDFWVSNNQMQMDATYLDKDQKIPYGSISRYSIKGTLVSVVNYENGESKTADYFYENGKKKGHIEYTKNGSIQNGWDEDGKFIPDYIVEREALFPGGLAGWRNYLEQNLDANAASKSKSGVYVVTIQFIVDKKGKVSNAKLFDATKGCNRCITEALRIIKKGPDWIPAYQNNVPVIYQALQKVTFMVEEEMP